MKWLELLLRTSVAQEAILVGFEKFVDTCDLNQGINEMIKRGKKNGSWPMAKLCFVFDLFGLK